MIKKLIIILLFIFIPFSVYAESEVSSMAEKWFTSYANKIDLKYTDSQEIAFFEKFSIKLDELLIIKPFTVPQKKLINDLIKLSNERVFTKKLKKIENVDKIILNSDSIFSKFSYKSYNKDHIFLENGVWYTYVFKKHLISPKGVKLKQEDLSHNGVDINKSIVFVKEDGLVGFAINYTKVKLISDNIIYGIPGKYNFLSEVKDDKETLQNETDLYFKKLKAITKNITEGKTTEEKIKSIYNYVLDNTTYTKNFSLDDARIFSGIETYKNKNGVCEGYTKIFLFMLNFANINNSEVIRGFVIDAQDFPQVGHAWVKIGNKYYDPTFDDPIGAKNTLTHSEYKYFGLPYDLFYTNRYTYETIPEKLKTETMEFRKSLIKQNIASLVKKYKNSNFNILKPYIFKLNNGINLEKTIDINDLKKIIPYSKVTDFKTTINGKNKKIKGLKFYSIDNSLVEDLLSQLNYKLEGYYLFNWLLEDGSYEYRLSYEVEFH